MKGAAGTGPNAVPAPRDPAPQVRLPCCDDHEGASPNPFVDGGLPTEATVAQVLVSENTDHYCSIDRHRFTPARASRSFDAGGLREQAAFHLRPLDERLLGERRQRPRHTDWRV